MGQPAFTRCDCINKVLVRIRLMQQRRKEVMSPMCCCEHQAIACLRGIPGLDASCSWIGTEQGIDGIPGISVMNCTGGKDKVLQFNDLRKERIGHGRACKMH